MARADGRAHVGEQGDDLLACAGPDAHQGRGERSGRVLDALHERAAADLHVEHQRVDAFGELLREDAGHDQRDGLHRRGHVAQRVDALVGGGDARGLTDETGAHLGDDLVETSDVEIHTEAGDRLEFVERAARVTEAAPRHHGDGHARGRDERRETERHLVAHAPGRVFVDLDPGYIGEIEHVARAQHGLREAHRLRVGHAPKEDGHEQRAHLVVGELSPAEGRDQAVNLRVAEGVSVPLAGDELDQSLHGTPCTPPPAGRAK